MVDSAGEANRSTSSHALNSASSRSHTVFTIHMQMRMLGEGEERAVTSKLNLVDLAGSERTKKTGVTGQALKVEPWSSTMFAFQSHASPLARYIVGPLEAHCAIAQWAISDVLDRLCMLC